MNTIIIQCLFQAKQNDNSKKLAGEKQEFYTMTPVYPASPYKYYWDNVSSTYTFIPYNVGFFNYHPLTYYAPTSYSVSLSAKKGKLRMQKRMKKIRNMKEQPEQPEQPELTEEQKKEMEILAKRDQMLILKDIILNMDKQSRLEIQDLLNKLK